MSRNLLICFICFSLFYLFRFYVVVDVFLFNLMYYALRGENKNRRCVCVFSLCV